MELTIFFILIHIFGLFIYWCYKKSNYWKDLKVPGPRAIPILGNFPRFILGQSSFPEDIEKVYSKWKHEPYIGVFVGPSPNLMIRDPELIKTVLIKDFNVFPSRGVHVPENDDSFASNLFNLEGHKWKVLRSKLTPLFTTGKLKHMVDLAAECAEHFEEYLIQEVDRDNVIEVREAAAKLTTNIIGSCAFGIEMNALAKEDSEFRKIGRKIFEPNKKQMIRRIIRVALPPKIARFLEKLLPSSEFNFFTDTIKETIDYRAKNNVIRNDLVDLLRDLKENKDNIDIKITDNILAAQAFLFFAAGFETSSTTISFVLHELAFAPEHQEKLRNEILETLKAHEGRITYEILNKMKFLNMVIQETLRKNSPAIVLKRYSVSPWTIPNTEITLPTGSSVLIPIYNLHHDSEFFPDPEKFDPSRFDDDNADTHSMTFLPFGSGPKNCIGERFAYYQVKLGIISILKNFTVKPSKFSKLKYEIDKEALILGIKGGVPLIFENNKL